MKSLLELWPILAAVAAGLLLIGGMEAQVLAQSGDHESYDEQLKVLRATTVVLSERAVAEDAREEGKEELRLELCRAGKLPDSECED